MHHPIVVLRRRRRATIRSVLARNSQSGKRPRCETHRRRAYVRFFACEQDLSHEPPDAPLPEAIASGAEPFIVMGAMSGG